MYPPGIRFVPTDEELVIEYLNKKINNQPLPIEDIRVLNLYEVSPDFVAGLWNLFLFGWNQIINK